MLNCVLSRAQKKRTIKELSLRSTLFSTRRGWLLGGLGRFLVFFPTFSLGGGGISPRFFWDRLFLRGGGDAFPPGISVEQLAEDQ